MDVQRRVIDRIERGIRSAEIAPLDKLDVLLPVESEDRDRVPRREGEDLDPDLGDLRLEVLGWAVRVRGEGKAGGRDRLRVPRGIGLVHDPDEAAARHEALSGWNRDREWSRVGARSITHQIEEAGDH